MDARKHPWRVIGESVESLPPHLRSSLLRAFASSGVGAFFGNENGPDFFDALVEVGHFPELGQVASSYARTIRKADGRVIHPEGFAALPEREPDPVDTRAQQADARELEWKRIAQIPDHYERQSAEKKMRRLHGPPMPGSLTP